MSSNTTKNATGNNSDIKSASHSNTNAPSKGAVMGTLESLPIDWRILLVLLIVVIVGIYAYRKGVFSNLGSSHSPSLEVQP